MKKPSKHGAEGAVRKKVKRVWLIRLISMFIVCGLLVFLAVSHFNPRPLAILASIIITLAYIIALIANAEGWFELNDKERVINTRIETFITILVIISIAVDLIFSAVYEGSEFLLSVLLALIAVVIAGFVVGRLSLIFSKLPPELKVALTVVTDLIAVIALFLGVVHMDAGYILLSFLWVIPFVLGYFPFEDDERKLSWEANDKWDTMAGIIFFVITSLYVILLIRLAYLGLTKIF